MNHNVAAAMAVKLKKLYEKEIAELKQEKEGLMYYCELIHECSEINDIHKKHITPYLFDELEKIVCIGNDKTLYWYLEHFCGICLTDGIREDDIDLLESKLLWQNPTSDEYHHYYYMGGNNTYGFFDMDYPDCKIKAQWIKELLYKIQSILGDERFCSKDLLDDYYLTKEIEKIDYKRRPFRKGDSNKRDFLGKGWGCSFFAHTFFFKESVYESQHQSHYSGKNAR